MKKKGSFLILLGACIFMSLFTLLYDLNFCTNIAQSQKTSGVTDLSNQKSPFLMDVWLTGQWEFYPNELLFSDAPQKNVSGHIETVDPAQLGDQQYKGESHQIDKPSGNYQTSLKSNPNADTIYLPAGFALFYKQFPNCQRASYRMVLRNCPVLDSYDMVLSLTGMAAGNYRLFINGYECRSFVSPHSYPEYFTTLPSDLEIVLEVSNTSIPFNICPRLSYKGTSMAAIDSYKYNFFGISCALVSAFLILMLLIFSLDSSRYRWHFGIGLLFSVYYIWINLWASGFLDPITTVIPTYLLFHLSSVLLRIGFIFVFFTIRKFYAAYYPQRQLKYMIGLLLLSCLLYIIGMVAPYARLFTILSIICIVVVFLHCLILTLKILPEAPLDLFLFQIGLLVLTLGANTSMVYHFFGILNFTIYILPGCLFAYVVLIFISTKFSQKALMQKTIHLLEVEKEASRMQAAMLSSQMRPHFLHNALTSIQEMCYTEPTQAADMIVHLSQYLRRNIDFMDYDNLIPFSDELEHIHNYMYIQHARYGEDLNFEEYLGYTDFLIPPLSIQPLIENAINYGIRKNSNHGTVRLKTYLEGNLICIQVSNSGYGFDPDHTKKNHSIYNIQKRLDTYLHGKMQIASSPEKLGTLITISFTQEDVL